MFDKEFLEKTFPKERTDDFFEALFGGAEDGAYTISLRFHEANDKKLVFSFDLDQRNNQCLKCNMTTGLPQVFERHPIINTKSVAEELAKKAGFQDYTWKLGHTVQVSDKLHYIPLIIEAK